MQPQLSRVSLYPKEVCRMFLPSIYKICIHSKTTRGHNQENHNMNFQWREDVICYCSSQIGTEILVNAHTQFGFVQYAEDLMMSGKDFRRNMETAWEQDGHYATDVFTNVTVDIIKSHNKSSPLFLYVAHAAVHAGNVGKPLEAPQEIVNKFSYISDPNRRTYAGKLEHFSNRVITPLSSARHDASSLWSAFAQAMSK